jgi:ABC-type nitrate/sulfonate/bicarbonate transport system substrate-binding protein
MKRTTITAAVLGLIVVFGGAVFFASRYLPATSGKRTPVTVRLAWLHQAQFAGMYVAQEKGFYADEGLDVTLKEYDFNLKSDEELASGKSDFAVVSAQELIASIDRGESLKAIGVIYQVSPYAFASRKELNITTPADFRGKVLGIGGGSQEGRVTYQALMSRFGLTTADVTFKDLGFDSAADLKNGEADVQDLYRTDQVFPLQKEGIAFNLLLPEQFDFSIYGDVLITSDSMLKNHPDLVEKFARATFKGWEYAITRVDETLPIVAKFENEQYKDPEHERFILEQSVPLISPIGQQHVGDMQYLKWKKTYDAMRSAGVLQNEIKVTDIYSSTFEQ